VKKPFLLTVHHFSEVILVFGVLIRIEGVYVYQ